MTPKRRAQVVRWLVARRKGPYYWPPQWLNRELTAYERIDSTVLAYGMDDGTVRWRLED